MIYIAGPYAHPDPLIMEERFDKLTRFAGELMKAGIVVYSPITHNHPVATRIGLPRTWEFWKKMDLAFLEEASQLIVVMLPGWDLSIGVKAEIEFAKQNNISVTYAEYL